MGEAHGLIAGKCGQARQVLLAIASPLQWAGVYLLWGRATLPRHIIKLQRLELEIQNRKSVEYSQLRHVNIASRVRMPKPDLGVASQCGYDLQTSLRSLVQIVWMCFVSFRRRGHPFTWRR